MRLVGSCDDRWVYALSTLYYELPLDESNQRPVQMLVESPRSKQGNLRIDVQGGVD